MRDVARVQKKQVERLHVKGLTLEDSGAKALVQLVVTHPKLSELSLTGAQGPRSDPAWTLP